MSVCRDIKSLYTVFFSSSVFKYWSSGYSVFNIYVYCNLYRVWYIVYPQRRQNYHSIFVELSPKQKKSNIETIEDNNMCIVQFTIVHIYKIIIVQCSYYCTHTHKMFIKKVQEHKKNVSPS